MDPSPGTGTKVLGSTSMDLGTCAEDSDMDAGDPIRCGNPSKGTRVAGFGVGVPVLDVGDLRMSVRVPVPRCGIFYPSATT